MTPTCPKCEREMTPVTNSIDKVIGQACFECPGKPKETVCPTCKYTISLAR